MPLRELPQRPKVVQLPKQALKGQLEFRQKPRVLVIGVDLVRKAVELYGRGQVPRPPLRSRESEPISFAGQFILSAAWPLPVQAELMLRQIIDELRNRQPFRSVFVQLA